MASIYFVLEQEKLDGCNNWKIQMRSLFMARRDWKIVTGKEQPPIDPKDLREYEDIDSNAIAAITLSVSKHILHHLANVKTSHETWTRLWSIYELRNEAIIIYFEKQLVNTRRREGESVIDFITKIKQITEELGSTREKMQNKELVQTTLNKLPRSFEMLKTGSTIKFKAATMTFDELMWTSSS
eukprot:Gb_36813 [translate_table: standard]